ncbi:MAG: TauD/TfdA family dioxygenase, partial [Gammaproteobacteria bacterium]|nr:TauD/TfdA family dioxygenase [Gammaproteobacteria bacterium]
VDLSRPLDDAALAGIVELLHRHEVILLRDQHITPAQHVALSRRIGELEIHVRADCLRPGHPEIFVVSNVVENGAAIGSNDTGQFWHTDLCYLAKPSRASVFYALEVPEKDGVVYGDTLFASATAAYEALPEDTKRRIAGLKVVQSYERGYYNPNRRYGRRKPLTAEQKAKTPDIEHPLVRTHPYTGRKCLFVNEGYSAGIHGLPDGEAQALLETLLAHATRPEFVYRHNWRRYDLLIWDNCATQHRAISDYELPLRRRMDRTTLTGTAPF